MNKILFRIVETDDELQQCFAVRHSVFVEEQRIFFETDQDEYDKNAIHIVAIDNNTGKVVGTVRCNETKDGIWYGARLAVAKEFRTHPSLIGVKLSIIAEKTVADRGAKRFLAYIQPNNVRFFERLNWRKLDQPVTHFGSIHQLMEASLFRMKKKTECYITRKEQTTNAQY
jgi:putative N-acetyltransferase (TIGR04045 family)